MISTVTTSKVSDPFDSFTVTDIKSAPVNVYVPPTPQAVIEAAKPIQTHDVTVIDTATIMATIKTLATLGALYLLGAALLALATLFINIVMPIIFGLVLVVVLAMALKNTRVGDLLQQILSQLKQPAPQQVPVRVENGES